MKINFPWKKKRQVEANKELLELSENLESSELMSMGDQGLFYFS